MGSKIFEICTSQMTNKQNWREQRKNGRYGLLENKVSNINDIFICFP